MKANQKAAYVLKVPGHSGVLMRADEAIDDGDSLRLFDGGQVVAVASRNGLAVDANSLVSDVALLPPSPPSVGDPAMHLGVASGCRECYSASFLLVTLVAGFCGGFGVAMSHAGVW